jgi:hypothetical protein
MDLEKQFNDRNKMIDTIKSEYELKYFTIHGIGYNGLLLEIKETLKNCVKISASIKQGEDWAFVTSGYSFENHEDSVARSVAILTELEMLTNDIKERFFAEK